MTTTTVNPAVQDLDDDEYDFLAEVEKKRFNAKFVSRVLIALLVLGAVFWGGIAAQKQWGSASSGPGGAPGGANAGARAGFGGAVPGATGVPGAATGQGQAAGANGRTSGSVTLVDGANVYVTDTNGNVVKVATTQNSKVTKTVAGAVGDLKPGDTINVQGATGTDGTVTASTITVGAAGTGNTRAAG